MSPSRLSDRGQLVVLAAAAIALALFPLTLAYLQLGYAGDVDATPSGSDAAADLERALDRAAHDSLSATAGEYAWSEREDAVDAYRDAVADALPALETAGLESGVAAEIGYAPSLAETVANEECPGGPSRAFGPCEAYDGVVVQERAGETVVVAVALDVTVVRDDGRTELEVVVNLAG